MTSICDRDHDHGTPRKDSLDGRIVESVVLGVAAVKDVGPLELTPLFHVLDPDALDAVFDSGGADDHTELEVRFRYEGCRVTVRANGDVDVRRIRGEDEGQQADD